MTQCSVSQCNTVYHGTVLCDSVSLPKVVDPLAGEGNEVPANVIQSGKKAPKLFSLLLQVAIFPGFLFLAAWLKRNVTWRMLFLITGFKMRRLTVLIPVRIGFSACIYLSLRFDQVWQGTKLSKTKINPHMDYRIKTNYFETIVCV